MFNKYRLFYFVILIITLSLLLGKIVTVNAEEMIIKYEKVNPKDGFSYAVKRLQEKFFLQLYFLFPERKLDYYFELTERRLAELKFTIENKDMANFENTTTRYSSGIGEYVGFILNTGKTDENKKKVEKLLLLHIPVLEKLRDVYDSTTAEWRFVEDDINFVKIHINSLH